ncbi:unnamed protein product [Caenorhabditis sp. 36 PRJEB53466]|nr:unnamed protein product [Caenorhabditis sp. 36 PRJEB53466]
MIPRVHRKKGEELRRPDLKGNFECATCNQKFTHNASLNRHRLTRHVADVTCLLCNEQLDGSLTISNHMLLKHNHHPVFTCGCCNWTFVNKKHMIAHMASIRKTSTPGDVEPIAKSRYAPGSLQQAVTPIRQRLSSGAASLVSCSSSSSSPEPAPKAVPLPFRPILRPSRRMTRAESPADLKARFVKSVEMALSEGDSGALADLLTVTQKLLALEPEIMEQDVGAEEKENQEMIVKKEIDFCSSLDPINRSIMLPNVVIRRVARPDHREHFRCTYCNQTFKHKATLERHRRSHHVVVVVRPRDVGNAPAAAGRQVVAVRRRSAGSPSNPIAEVVQPAAEAPAEEERLVEAVEKFLAVGLKKNENPDA